MANLQHNQESVNPLQQPEVPEHSMSWRTKMFLGVASLAIIGAAVYVVDATGSEHKNSDPSSYTEITVTDNTLASSKDFASKPTWSQDFSKTANGALNPAYWVYDQGTGGPTDLKWGNNEAEYYTKNADNVQIKDGVLDITARQQQYHGSDYTSARIKTEGKVDVEYGKIDVVAKLPNGIGTWPAIWMLSENNLYYSEGKPNDPLKYLNPGEIDIMEEIGVQPGSVSSSAQSYSYNEIVNTERIETETIPDADTSFHDYGLEWTPTQLVFTVDGKPYHIVNKHPGDTYKAWPYDQPYFLIINDALGGVWGGSDRAQYPPDGINNAQLPVNFQIKSINYSPYIGPK